MPRKTTDDITEDIAPEDTVLANGGYGIPLSYEELTDDAELEVIAGSELAIKKDLIGDPFVITAFVFRPSAASEAEYVSVYAVAKGAGEVIFNDGSKGVRRQLMDYAFSKGWITPPTDIDTDSEDKATENAGDLPLNRMAGFNLPATLSYDETGSMSCHIEGIKLHARRGLRESEYKYLNPETGREQDVSTFYLA